MVKAVAFETGQLLFFCGRQSSYNNVYRLKTGEFMVCSLSDRF